MKKYWLINKNKIIKFAQQNFKKYGFKKTSLNDIAISCRKSKSSIYHYFTSKDEIFEAVCEMELNNFEKAVIKKVFSLKSPKKQLKKYFKERIEIIKDCENLFNVINNEYFDDYSFARSIRKRYLENEINTLKRILSSGVEEKVFAIPDIERVANSLSITLRGLEISLFKGNKNYDIDEEIDNIFRMILNGLSGRKK